MATHSSILAWRIPWTEEPGRLQSVGSQRVGHDWRCYYCEPHLTYIYRHLYLYMDFPGGSDDKASVYNEGFDPWVRKITWRRKRHPTRVLLPGKSRGWRSLMDYSPRGHKESDMTERLHFHFDSLTCNQIFFLSQRIEKDFWLLLSPRKCW